MQFYLVSDRGRLRENNEDSSLAKEIGEFTLLILADGMGGHKGGETASRTAISEIYSILSEELSEKMLPGQIMLLLSDAVEKANEKLFSLAKEDAELSGMGTTCDICLVFKGTAYIAHVGDSRVYRISESGDSQKLTKDHSLVEFMLESGTITPEEAATHPQKNIILRALGIEKQVEADISHVKLRKGDTLLLCSDGLTNMLDEETVFKTVTEETDPEKSALKLVSLANEAGGTDNITVITARL